MMLSLLRLLCHQTVAAVVLEFYGPFSGSFSRDTFFFLPTSVMPNVAKNIKKLDSKYYQYHMFLILALLFPLLNIVINLFA